MAKLTIETANHQTHYHPGDVVSGFVGWELDEPPAHAELRLFWYTQGRGTRDAAVVATRRWDAPPATDVPLFEFILPGGPISFNGKLVSIVWALELVVAGCSDVARVELVVSPTRQEVVAVQEAAI